MVARYTSRSLGCAALCVALVNHVPMASAMDVNPDAGTSEKSAQAGPSGYPVSQPGSIVALDIDITLDQVSPEEPGITIGQHHEARIYYDKTKIDPKTRRVVVIHQQHTPMLIPKHLNPLQEPMSNAWLDMSGPDYRYHMAASPTGGGFPFPYSILFDEKTMRMTIRKQSDGTMLLSGPYTVSRKELTGPNIDAVVASSDPVKMPWEADPPFGMRPAPGLSH